MNLQIGSKYDTDPDWKGIYILLKTYVKNKKLLCLFLNRVKFQIQIQCVRYQKFTLSPGVDVLWKFNLIKTLRKLYISTKLPHYEIRWNFKILQNGRFNNAYLLREEEIITITHTKATRSGYGQSKSKVRFEKKIITFHS